MRVLSTGATGKVGQNFLHQFFNGRHWKGAHVAMDVSDKGIFWLREALPTFSPFHSNRLDNNKARLRLNREPKYDFHQLTKDALTNQCTVDKPRRSGTRASLVRSNYGLKHQGENTYEKEHFACNKHWSCGAFHFRRCCCPG